MKSFIFFIVYLCALPLMSAEEGASWGSDDFPYHKTKMLDTIQILEEFVFECALPELPYLQKMFNNLDSSDKNASYTIALGIDESEEGKEARHGLERKESWFVILSDISDKDTFQKKILCPERKSSYFVYQVSVTDTLGEYTLPWMLCGNVIDIDDMQFSLKEAVISIVCAEARRNQDLCMMPSKMMRDFPHYSFPQHNYDYRTRSKLEQPEAQNRVCARGTHSLSDCHIAPITEGTDGAAVPMGNTEEKVRIFSREARQNYCDLWSEKMQYLTKHHKNYLKVLLENRYDDGRQPFTQEGMGARGSQSIYNIALITEGTDGADDSDEPMGSVKERVRIFDDPNVHLCTISAEQLSTFPFVTSEMVQKALESFCGSPKIMAWFQALCAPAIGTPPNYSTRFLVCALAKNNPDLRFRMDQGNLCVEAEEQAQFSVLRSIQYVFADFFREIDRNIQRTKALQGKGHLRL